MSAHTNTFTYHCAICGKPLDLRECKTCEDGKAVHDDCYFRKVSGVIPLTVKKPPATQIVGLIPPKIKKPSSTQS